MKELAADLATVLTPYVLLQWWFDDPLINGVWVAAAVTVRWAKRRRKD